MGAFATELSALEADTLAANAQRANLNLPELRSGETSQSESSPQSPKISDDAAAAEVATEPEVRPMELPGNQPIDQVASAQVGGDLVVEAPAADVASEPGGGEEWADTRETAAPSQYDAERSEEKAPVNSWFSRPTSPWDAEPHKTNPLAASWDTGSAAQETGVAATVKDNASEARNGNGESSPDEAASVLSDESAVEVVSGHAEPTTEADMDALVAKVFARMSPDVLQAVTREILKPVIAAILEDELKLKK
jgi:hypothetical protein